MKNAMKRVYNTSAPKMTNHAGRTWDVAKVTLPNGETTKAHFDTTWGEFFYFQVDGKWYRGSVEYQKPNSWDFDIRKDAWKNNGARPATYVGDTSVTLARGRLDRPWVRGKGGKLKAIDWRTHETA